MAEPPDLEPRPRPAEERGHDRYEGRIEASLWLEGGAWRCWICDLSVGGAGLEPAIPAALGKQVTLSSRFFDFDGELPGQVVNVAQQRTCVAFQLDPATRDKLSRFLATHA